MKDLKRKIKKLPNEPGIYIFKDKNGQVLYVGKATNLKSRVSSYFGHSNAPIRPIEAMIGKVADIEIQETDSVLEALFLESQLIKKLQPKYNAMGKDDKSFSYIILTKEIFPRFVIVRQTDLEAHSDNFKAKSIYGPYASKKQIEIALKILRKIFPYHSLPKKSEKGCLDFQIGLCPGPYAGAMSKEDYRKNISSIRMILEGKKKSLIKKMEKEMQEYAQKNEFEKAAEIRNKIFALQHIRDVALISKEKTSDLNCRNLRIEAYDISNISGKYATGSMVVFESDQPNKNEYRKFRIKTVVGSNDVGMMAEVLFRRFHNDWPRPDLIILDGGQGHLNMGQKVLKELGVKVPLVAVAKGPTRKISNYKILTRLPDGQVSKQATISNEIKNILKDRNLISAISNEAHRFAIVYHKKLRQKAIKY
jgi:excinuclease ABC subunit C